MTYHAPKEAILDFQDGGGVSDAKAAKVITKLYKEYPGIQELAR